MLDQLVVGKRGTFEDFEASLKQRTISLPEKKSIKQTVPFSNVTYDFSAVDGEVYWEERALDYVFEIMADTPEELEQKKAAFFSFIMNVMNEELHDPYDPDWHYFGTYETLTPSDDDSVEKSTITVTFAVYPYKIANNRTAVQFVVPAGGSVEKAVLNESSHRITPTLIATAPLSMQIGSTIYNVPQGETKDDSCKIEPGASPVIVTNDGAEACELTIEFFCEVF